MNSSTHADEEEGSPMSLDVPAALLERAEAGEVGDAAFLAVVRESLPYAYRLVAGVVDQLQEDEAPFADNQVPPPSEAERGQLLRALASDAIRGGLERHFGVKLAFQNCHRVAAFREPLDARAYQAFTSPRDQILNQSPQLRDC
jgi:hypothetical protein